MMTRIKGNFMNNKPKAKIRLRLREGTLIEQMIMIISDHNKA